MIAKTGVGAVESQDNCDRQRRSFDDVHSSRFSQLANAINFTR